MADTAIKFEVDVIGNKEIVAKLEKAPDVVNGAMDDIALDFVGRIQKALQGKNDTGQLHTNEFWIIGKGAGKFDRTITAAKEYATYVEQGTGPAAGHGMYWPQYDAIAHWCNNHGIDDTGVFPVMKKIHDYGIEPFPFVDRAMESVGDTYKKYLDDALAQAGVTG